MFQRELFYLLDRGTLIVASAITQIISITLFVTTHSILNKLDDILFKYQS